jgi:hypothetical protein
MYARTAVTSTLAAALILLNGAVAAAESITGALWRVPEATAQNPVLSNVPARAADVTFRAPSQFAFSANTVGSFLSSGGAFDIVENLPGTLSSPVVNGANGTIVELTGLTSVLLGSPFTFTYNGALTFNVAGLNLISAPPSSVATGAFGQWTGQTSVYPFELIYGGCCGTSSSRLEGRIPLGVVGPVPEPSTLTLLAGAVLAAFSRRRQGRACNRDQARTEAG